MGYRLFCSAQITLVSSTILNWSILHADRAEELLSVYLSPTRIKWGARLCFRHQQTSIFRAFQVFHLTLTLRGESNCHWKYWLCNTANMNSHFSWYHELGHFKYNTVFRCNSIFIHYSCAMMIVRWAFMYRLIKCSPWRVPILHWGVNDLNTSDPNVGIKFPQRCSYVWCLINEDLKTLWCIPRVVRFII